MDTWCSPTPPYTEYITNLYPIINNYNRESIINYDIKSSLIYRDCGPNTSNRINRFYSLVSQHLDTIYLAPYHPSRFSKVNQHKAKRVKNPLILSSYLEREVINSLSLVHESDDLIILAKSTGVLNSGISLFCIQNNEILESEGLILDGYDGFHRPMKYFLDGKIWSCNHNSKIYVKDLTSSCISGRNFRDLDLLEIKSDSKNSNKSIIYARNFYGFIALSFDLQSKIPKIIKSFNDSKIYNMSISPYESGTLSLLSKNNLEVQSLSSDRKMNYDLSVNSNTDIQTLSYGSSPFTFLIASHNLYIKDIRSGEIMQSIIDNGIKAHISTNSRWSFRRVKNKPLHKDRRYFSADSCAYSNYYRESENIFWDAITAIAPHPIHLNIVAFVYGVSDCIYIFDLNMPTQPLYELPISDSVHLGSRCRHLEWIESNGYYKWLLVPFNWRDNIINVFQFDCNITLSTPKHIIFKPEVDVLKESTRFPNYSGLFETCNDISMPILSAESNLLNLVFHGYSGIAFTKIDGHLHSLISTTSGRLIDVSLDNNVLDECIVDDIATSNVDVTIQKNRVISIPDDEFLDGLCDIKARGSVDHSKRMDIPKKFRFDSTLASSQCTIGLIDRVNDFSDDGVEERYNAIPVEDGFKYFKIDGVLYITDYSWKRLERVERLDQRCPYSELYSTYDQNVRQNELSKFRIQSSKIDCGDFKYGLIDDLDDLLCDINQEDVDFKSSGDSLDGDVIGMITSLCNFNN